MENERKLYHIFFTCLYKFQVKDSRLPHVIILFFRTAIPSEFIQHNSLIYTGSPEKYLKG